MRLDNLVFTAVLFGALLHAGWNSIVKIGLDRTSTAILLCLAQALIAVVVLPFAAPPAPEAWPWIAASILLHVGYMVFLVQAYAHADVSQAYPLARGSAPMIVMLWSVLFLGASFSKLSIMAVVAISLGILIMARLGAVGGMMRGAALFWALGTAGFIAGYTLVDGIGVRISGTPTSYLMWTSLGLGIGMVGYGAALRGRSVFTGILPAWRSGLAAGAMAIGSYWIALWAFTQAPIALVAALRESSILFATLIATFLLRETVGPWRWLSIGVIACGVVLIKV